MSSSMYNSILYFNEFGAKKIEERKNKKQVIQDELIRELKGTASGYENVWNRNLPAVKAGRKTGLYNELRSIIGRCG